MDASPWIAAKYFRVASPRLDRCRRSDSKQRPEILDLAGGVARSHREVGVQ